MKSLFKVLDKKIFVACFSFLMVFGFVGLSSRLAADEAAKTVVGVVTGKSFKTDVQKSSLPVLIDFWATWCGPCRVYGPIVDKVAQKYQGKLKVFRMEADAKENQEIIQKYNIQALPTTLLIKNGKVIQTTEGLISQDELEGQVNKLLKSFSKLSAAKS